MADTNAGDCVDGRPASLAVIVGDSCVAVLLAINHQCHHYPSTKITEPTSN